MIFNLDERHSLKATVLESGKKCINWVSVGTFEPYIRPLWVNFTALKFLQTSVHSKLYLA